MKLRRAIDLSPYKRIDPTEQLERMAQAIRINPEITVQELKDVLGYAQEKSVYYWLKKSPYKSVRKFRKAVLTGQYNPNYPFPPEHLSQSAESPPRCVPLAIGFTPEGKVETSGQTIPVLYNYSRSAFAYRIETNEYFPYFNVGDILIIDPEENPKAGCFLFIFAEDKPQIHRFYPGKPSLLIHPAKPHKIRTILTPKDKILLMGQVVQLIRSFG
jgi:hypothetical protein